MFDRSDLSSDDRSGLGNLASSRNSKGAADVSDDFWGSSPTWNSTGSVPRVRRSGRSGAQPRVRLNRVDRTGPIERTRSHGIVRPEEAAQFDEAFDDADYRYADASESFDWQFDPDLTVEQSRVAAQRPSGNRAGTRSHSPTPTRRAAAPRSNDGLDLADRRSDRIDHEYADRLDDEFADAPMLPLVERLTERAGLGAIDPLLVRLGAILLVGVLMVPLAMALRSDAADGAVVAEPMMAALQVPAIAASPTPPQSTDSAPVTEPAVESAAVAVEVQTAAEGTIDISALPQAVPVQHAADATAVESAAASEAADAVEATTPSTGEVESAAKIVPAETADRQETTCTLSYEVRAGNSWIWIASEAGVELNDLLRANRASTSTTLLPGDEICLPDGATVPSTPAVPSPPAATSPPTTTAPPTTTTPKPSTNLSQDQVKQIIRDEWPDELEDRAIEIAWRESGWKPGVRNYCCIGLFQIYWSVHRGWLDGVGVHELNHLYDARLNARAAYTLYQRAGGWGPWGF